MSKLKESDNHHIPDEFVSVIIPFRNEKENLLLNLKSIENQDYPRVKFEVIYVDDSSDDGSAELILKNKKSDHIKVISVPKNFSLNAHKKRAVRFGIQNASGEIIVTSDADCEYEKSWLKSLLINFKSDTGFVSGPVQFKADDKLFSKIQQLEFAGLVLTGAGLIGYGSPTICNAANIAYRKKAFNEVNGFNDNMDLSSGDDEFLMQKISSDTNYFVKFSSDISSIVKTNPNKNAKEFYQQRKRWASKGLFYADKTLVLKLILIYLFYCGLIVQPVFGLVLNKIFWYTFIISLFIKFVLEFSILNKGRKILFSDLSLKPFLITEILQIPYIITAGLLGAFGNFIWKQRKVSR